MAVDISSEWVRRIGEVGFLAAGHGQVEAAHRIFDGLVAIRPDSEYPWIGKAIAELQVGRETEALRLLRDEAIKRNPHSPEAQVFVGLALKRAGRGSEAEATLQAVSKAHPEQAAGQMAKAFLEP
ncbi:MAG: tetratricopeptide repeat protein [Pseudomonadota bacterium]